jgi:hypothetical protein
LVKIEGSQEGIKIVSSSEKQKFETSNTEEEKRQCSKVNQLPKRL